MLIKVHRKVDFCYPYIQYIFRYIYLYVSICVYAFLIHSIYIYKALIYMYIQDVSNVWTDSTTPLA